LQAHLTLCRPHEAIKNKQARSPTMETEPPTRRDLAILYASMAISRVGFGVIIIIFPSYISRSSDIAVAFALAAYPILEAASALPMGRLCDTRGRRIIFAASLAYMAVLMASIGLTRNIFAIAGIHALMGIGAAGVTVSSLTMITDLTRVSNRGVGMGTFDFANIGGYALGLLIGGRLEAEFSSDLSYAFFVTGAAVAASFAVSILALKEPPHSSESGAVALNPFRALDQRTKAILPLWVSITSLIGIVFFLPRALAAIGLRGGATAALLFAGIVLIGAGSIGFGALSDRVGRTKVLVVGVLGLMGLLLTASISIQAGSKGLLAAFPLIGVFALATSALVPSILATVGDRARETMRGSAMGLYSVMLSGGIAVGTLVAGYAHSVGGLTGILAAGAVIFGIASVASLLLWRRGTTGSEVGKGPRHG
jgi:MFS family permease